MSNIGKVFKEIVQAAAAAFDAPPESVVVVDEYGNEWTYAQGRTCHDTAHFDGCFECSACGEGLEDPRQEPNFVKWCPFCGAKVVD